jgi:hypothetical protein
MTIIAHCSPVAAISVDDSREIVTDLDVTH